MEGYHQAVGYKQTRGREIVETEREACWSGVCVLINFVDGLKHQRCPGWTLRPRSKEDTELFGKASAKKAKYFLNAEIRDFLRSHSSFPFLAEETGLNAL